MVGLNLYQSHADAFAGVQNLLGDSCPSIVWNGATIQAIPNSAVDRHNLGIGGFALDFQLRLFFLVAPFLSATITTAEQAKEALLDTPFTYLGETYKVVGVDILPGALQLVITANSINQAA